MIEHDRYFSSAKEHIELLERRRTEICENAKSMEAELRELFKKSISRLHELTQLKLSDLLSEEAELRRRLEEIEWMNQFIQYQKQNVTPVNFLDSFAQHNSLKKERAQSMDLTLGSISQALEEVKPDIQASGEMVVISPTTQLEDQSGYKLIPLSENKRFVYDEQGNVLATVVEEPGEENGVYLDDEELLIKNQDPNECKIS